MLVPINFGSKINLVLGRRVSRYLRKSPFSRDKNAFLPDF